MNRQVFSRLNIFISLSVGLIIVYFVLRDCLPVEIDGEFLSTDMSISIRSFSENRGDCCPCWMSWASQIDLDYRKTKVLCRGNIIITLNDIEYGTKIDLRATVEGDNYGGWVQLGESVEWGDIKFIYLDDDIKRRMVTINVARNGFF